MTRLFLAFALFALASACGKKTAPAPPPQPDAGSAPVAEVEAIDEFGPLPARVNDIDFWIHPAVPFNSLVIAATDAGLVALNIEDGSEVARIGGFAATGVEVIYANIVSLAPDEGAADAKGLVIVRDVDANFHFYAIDNASRGLSEIAHEIPPGETTDAWCAGPDISGGARIALLDANKVTEESLIFMEGDVTTALSSPPDLPGDAASCAITKGGADLFVLLKDGAVLRNVGASGARNEKFAASGAGRPAAIAYAANGAASDGDASDCCGQLFILDGADASLRVLDIDDGKALGTVRLASSFDVDAVAAATAIGVGYGNFGGAFREGVIALATDGANPVIRLAPLSGALQALGVAAGQTRNPRIETPAPIENQCANLLLSPGEPAPSACGADPAASDFAVPAPQ